METTLLAQCTREICELHDFFQAWFSGAISDSEANFRRFTDGMDETFTMVGPEGVLTELPPLTARLRSAYHKQAGIRIWTQNHRLLHHNGDLALCTYEEWQESADATTARLSTVLFRRQTAAPQGLLWLHVHETWMELH